jgi:hypothetical protein
MDKVMIQTMPRPGNLIPAIAGRSPERDILPALMKYRRLH